jgi:hypothetical protein
MWLAVLKRSAIGEHNRSQSWLSRQPPTRSAARRSERSMARLGRYFVKDQKLHVIQRGNNRQRIFFAHENYQLYRHWLAEAAQPQAEPRNRSAAVFVTLTPIITLTPITAFVTLTPITPITISSKRIGVRIQRCISPHSGLLA